MYASSARPGPSAPTARCSASAAAAARARMSVARDASKRSARHASRPGTTTSPRPAPRARARRPACPGLAEVEACRHRSCRHEPTPQSRAPDTKARQQPLCVPWWRAQLSQMSRAAAHSALGSGRTRRLGSAGKEQAPRRGPRRCCPPGRAGRGRVGAAPSSEKGKPAASPTPPGARGNSRRVGPTSASLVATASITLSPSTRGEPNTQNTSYASRPASSAAAARNERRPSSCARRAHRRRQHAPGHAHTHRQPGPRSVGGKAGAGRPEQTAWTRSVPMFAARCRHARPAFSMQRARRLSEARALAAPPHGA